MKYLSNKRSLVKILAAGYMLSACAQTDNTKFLGGVELVTFNNKYKNHEHYHVIHKAIATAPESWKNISFNGAEGLIKSGILGFCSPDSLNSSFRAGKVSSEEILKCIHRLVGTDTENADFYLSILANASEKNLGTLMAPDFNLSEHFVEFLKDQYEKRLIAIVNDANISFLNTRSKSDILNNLGNIGNSSFKYINTPEDLLNVDNLRGDLWNIAEKILQSLSTDWESTWELFINELLKSEEEEIVMNEALFNNLSRESKESIEFFIKHLEGKLSKNIKEEVLESLLFVQDGVLKLLLDNGLFNTRTDDPEFIHSLCCGSRKRVELLITHLEGKILAKMKADVLEELVLAEYGLFTLLLSKLGNLSKLGKDITKVEWKSIHLLCDRDFKNGNERKKSQRVAESILTHAPECLFNKEIILKLCDAPEEIATSLLKIAGSELVNMDLEFIKFLLNLKLDTLNQVLETFKGEISKVERGTLMYLCNAADGAMSLMFRAFGVEGLNKMSRDELIDFSKSTLPGVKFLIKFRKA